ncbi:MAG: acetylornithine deacetylase [Lysobacterales bacterium CG_4_9_14_3_um_filter_62_6]|nr:MAG: acetylornithine deacetylase [Xanthomonadales bacterium CG_4_9_14_3_um_filter_62_6]
MMPLLLEHLAALVAFDTENPPRAISSAGGIFDYLRAALPGFTFELCDHGAGAVSLLAVRGQPKLLFNVHVDTVPTSPAWTADPLRLRLTADRAIGLGACDIKGAAAALLSAATHSTGAAAFLFTSDEEANDARCIPAFLKKPRRFDAAIIAEPTAAKAVLAHRGIAAVRLLFRGRAGHASGVATTTDSALHHAVEWGHAALALCASLQSERFGGLTGLRFNIGRLEGGIKANVIAPSAELRFGFRPLPSQSPDALHLAFRGLVAEAAIAAYDITFSGPSLPAGDLAEAEAARLRARDMADALALPIGNAVDFWTEAALFSAAGITALVYGPGAIAQAHSADEWVALDQLQAVATNYQRMIDDGLC